MTHNQYQPITNNDPKPKLIQKQRSFYISDVLVYILLELTGLDADIATAWQVRQELRKRESTLTDEETEKIELLAELLEARDTMYHAGEEVEEISTYIDQYAGE